MKKIYYHLIPLFIIFFLSSCQRFDPPGIKLQMTNQKDSIYTFYSVIINGGGCEYFNEKGCVYGLNSEPTRIDGASRFFNIKSNEEDWFFSWTMAVRDSAERYFKVPDSTYYVYVRGWATTNAGIGYSNPMKVEIKIEKDTISK